MRREGAKSSPENAKAAFHQTSIASQHHEISVLQQRTIFINL
jgi:hypothetical protein